MWTDRFTLQKGYVFYERLNDSNQHNPAPWKALYDKTKIELDALQEAQITLKWSQIAQFLENMGQNEQQKEREMLNKLYGQAYTAPIDIKAYPEYIETLNDCIGLKEYFKPLIQLLRNSTTKKTRVPLPFSYFESYLGSSLHECMVETLKTDKAQECLYDGDIGELTKLLEKDVDRAINLAIEKINKQEVKMTDDEDDPGIQLWNFIKKGYEKLNDVQSSVFKQTIKSQYHLDEIPKRVAKWRFENANKRITKRSGFRTSVINTTLASGERAARSAAGYMHETLQMIFDSAHNNNGTLTFTNTAKIDSFRIVHGEVDVDFDELAKEFYNATEGSGSLKEMSENLIRFYDERLRDLPDTFVIYESAKAYSLSNEKFEFDAHGQRSLLDISEQIELATDNQYKGKDLIYILNQTIPGAMGQHNARTIDMQVKRMIIMGMAYTLFDDWTSIGQVSDNSIHMFDLDGVKVPLSYLCLGAANIIREISNAPLSFYRVSLSRPTGILYPSAQKSTDEINNSRNQDGKVTVNLIDLWNKQRDAAAKNITFQAHFLKEFKRLVMQFKV